MKRLTIISVSILFLQIACSEKEVNEIGIRDLQNEKTELIALGSYPDYYYNLANELNNSGRTELAIEAYNKCIATSKSQTFIEDAMYNLSMLCFQIERNEQALSLMDSLINRKYTWLEWYKNNESLLDMEAYQKRLKRIDSVVALKDNPANCVFHYEDLSNFIEAFNKSKSDWSSAPHYFYEDYFSKATKALFFYQKFKIQSSSHQFAYRIEDKQEYFQSIIPNLKGIKSQEPLLKGYLEKFEEIYPEAIFPDIYFNVGCFNAGGTSSPFGLIIGAEMHTKAENSDLTNFNDWEKTVVRDFSNLPLITIHELVHIQQNDNYDNLLGNSIFEGAADFISSLVCGSHINEYVHKWANEREQEVWDEFEKEMFGNNSRNWIGNADRAVDKPADLGYYVGFKICEHYYNQQGDKKKAVSDILNISDWKDFYEKSGYMR